MDAYFLNVFPYLLTVSEPPTVPPLPLLLPDLLTSRQLAHPPGGRTLSGLLVVREYDEGIANNTGRRHIVTATLLLVRQSEGGGGTLDLAEGSNSRDNFFPMFYLY